MANPLYKIIFSSATISTIMTILDDDDESIEAMMLLELQSELVANRVPRQRCWTRPFTGHQMLCDILSGHHECCCHHFRMSVTTFIALRDTLVERGLINSTRNITADEQLGIFLYGIGHGVANRILAETFQHSGETISRHFNNVLRGIVRLKDDYIMLPLSNAAVYPRIRNNPNFHPFKNVIGAVDGTHIPVVVERRWEGSAADMRVLRWACETGGFVVPEGKYYLVDSGYANTEKFLAPYRGERYHISHNLMTDHQRSESRHEVETGSHVWEKFADRTQFILELVDERRRDFDAFSGEIAGRMRFRVAMSFRLCGHLGNHRLASLASRQGRLICSEVLGASRCIFGTPGELGNQFWETDSAGSFGFVRDVRSAFLASQELDAVTDTGGYFDPKSIKCLDDLLVGVPEGSDCWPFVDDWLLTIFTSIATA
uniref:DUF8040 domain-containing protein n=1 Tax=Ananas comosus var. bracteatus TaxID=296719 RepID=A0A6V7PXW6_ANACO|nr:unnamed protein product [Ananas comosus var. bracteatus]